MNLTARNYKENTAEGFRNQSRNVRSHESRVQASQEKLSLIISQDHSKDSRQRRWDGAISEYERPNPHYLDKQVLKPTSIRSERSRTKRPESTVTSPVSRLVGAQLRYKCGAGLWQTFLLHQGCKKGWRTLVPKESTRNTRRIKQQRTERKWNYKKKVSDEELSHSHGQFIKTWTVNMSKERTFIWTTRMHVPAKRPSPHANPQVQNRTAAKTINDWTPGGAITSCMGASEGRNGTFKWWMNRWKNTVGQTDGARRRPSGWQVELHRCSSVWAVPNIKYTT